jgi:hypothetical protein
MNKAEMIDKKEKLENWLTKNPSHPNYREVLSDKKALESDIKDIENDNKTLS